MRRLFGSLLVALSCCAGTHAQQPATLSASEEDERPLIRDTTVGYVDSAIPGNVLRLRSDLAYNNRQPERAEFFYAETGAGHRGLPLDERSVDYQDMSLYIEHVLGDRLSAFVEVPYRMANFDINENHSGFSDINLGVKYALLSTECTVLSSQFRLYTPTGNAHLGLGTGHVSVEPSLLLYHKWTDRMASESELRFWGAIGGTAHVQGSLLRVGTGLHYDAIRTENLTVSPVTELVAWYFIDGAEDPAFGTNGPMLNAAGDTMVNAKLGVRFKMEGVGDFYAGYGRALTGEFLYKDMFRFEFRLLY